VEIIKEPWNHGPANHLHNQGADTSMLADDPGPVTTKTS